MVITEPIRQAIEAAIKESGSSLSFSRSVGVSHTTVSYWVKGRTRKINATVWNNLRPLLEDYLGDSVSPSSGYHYPTSAPMRPLTLHEQASNAYHVGKQTQNVNNNAPLFRFSDLAESDPVFDSAETLAEKKARGRAVFTSFVPPGYLAVEVDEKHSDAFPAGTEVLLGWRDTPDDGGTVLVKFQEDNRFLFARYGLKGGTVTLTPLRKGAKKLTMSKEEFHGACAWIVPVREAVRHF